MSVNATTARPHRARCKGLARCLATSAEEGSPSTRSASYSEGVSDDPQTVRFRNAIGRYHRKAVDRRGDRIRDSGVRFALASDSASAVVSGKNGRILFTRRVCTSTCVFEIIAADPNDTNEVVLAGPYPQDAFDEHLIANWSPDGRSAIFTVNSGIWEVNADGSGLHLLVQGATALGEGFGAGPSFTPDGKSIVMEHCCKAGIRTELYTMNADGTGLRQLSTLALNASESEPQVSPDGSRIVFNLCREGTGCVIATVGINGGNLHQLTDPALDSTHPNWSPDSKKIVFTMQPTVNGMSTADIASINPDGSGFTQLTFNPPGKGLSFQPCYSPDGTKILFVHAPSTGDRDLFTMNPDGTGIAQVTKTASRENEPEWARVS